MTRSSINVFVNIIMVYYFCQCVYLSLVYIKNFILIYLCVRLFLEKKKNHTRMPVGYFFVHIYVQSLV